MSSTEVPRIELTNGVSIPVLGLGTWLSPTGKVKEAVKTAIEVGYRHIDCAFAYLNEKEIGEGIKEGLESTGLKREDLFITTKLWNSFHEYEKVKTYCKESLKDLGLEYIDLYLIHWPIPYQAGANPYELFPINSETGQVDTTEYDYVDTWRAMEELLEEGLVKSIGVSNFNIPQLKRVLENCRIKPQMQQIEIHSKLSNKKQIEFCHANGIAVTAYSALGNNGVPEVVSAKSWSLLTDERVTAIAEKYGKSPAQVLLRFPIDRGIVVLAKSITPERIKSNFDIFDFQLTKEEVEILSNFEDQERIVTLKRHANHKFYPFLED